MSEIRTLFLGPSDLSEKISISEKVEWFYEPDFSQLPKKYFDVVIIDRDIKENEFEFLKKYGKAYTFFFTKNVNFRKNSLNSLLRKMKIGKVISNEEIKDLLEKRIDDYYPNPYGEKYTPNVLSVAQGFNGSVIWRGYDGIELNGDYGEDFCQIVYWRINIPIELNQTLEFWLEYEKDDSISLELDISLFKRGSISELIGHFSFSEDELKDIVEVTNTVCAASLFASVRAKGNGRLKIIALHDRFSRRGIGTFLPGGQRYVTSKREEVFYYFDPGNLKPPLNVYFSGYKTLEGFEAYNLIKHLDHPFLLLSESRLDGGAFYLGDQEYEDAIVAIINNSLKALNFDNSQLVLSGLSMGTFGAVYYGAKLQPNTVLIGKPLTSLGDVAYNERINRPGGFPTSLDVLYKNYGSLDEDAIDKMNKRMWDTFDAADWSNTRIAVAYMLEDDYDSNAFANMQSHLKDAGVRIYGKGLHGRHNDNTDGIVLWFVGQYKKIMKEFEKNEK